ncbi:MAG: enoyl-CoA hydratase-related protein [Dehalococcoidia bacterium]
MIDYSKFAEVNLPVELDDGVVTVTINRPERRNALGGGMHDAIEELLVLFNKDERVRAVILTGAGDKAFCAGADVKDMAERSGEGAPRPLGGVTKNAKWLIHHFLNLEVPIIAAINGDAVGLGATLALMCDITLMADTARIGDTHVRVGLVAGDGGALIWPFLIGMNRAKELLMTGRLVGAEECERIGLVNRVVPQAQLMDETRALARELANGAPLAIRWTKLSLNQHIWQQVVNSHHYSTAVEALTMASEDIREGTMAFAEKRQPDWKGR